MDLRSLQTMSPNEFKKMFNDIGKGYKISDYDTIEPLYIHLHPRKMLYGFRCMVETKIKAVYEFKHLITNVAICDWLDYNGFARPKWTPNGMTMKDTIISGYERAEANVL